MSYDLDFWRYKTGVYLNNQEVYERLSNGEPVDGLEELPIAEMIAAIKSSFSVGWETTDDQTWEHSNRGIFQIFTTSQFFRVDCYGMEGEDMNHIIDVGSKFGCPLYDPQVGRRFDNS